MQSFLEWGVVKMIENMREYQREYRLKNKEKIREIQRKYRANNREKLAEKHREYYYTNRERILESQTAHYYAMTEGTVRRQRVSIFEGIPESMLCAYITGKTSEERGSKEC